MWKGLWQEPSGKENRGGGKCGSAPWQGHCIQSKAQEAKPEAQTILEAILISVLPFQDFTLTCLSSSVFPVKLACRVLVNSRVMFLRWDGKEVVWA